MAADMPVRPPAAPVAFYDWSGAYVGFNAGATWYDTNRQFPNMGGGFPPGGNFTTSDSDGIYGFHAGAQRNWGAWVLGAEAALSGCFNECRTTSGQLDSAVFPANVRGEHKATNLFTAGPRLGYAWDRLMMFAIGGWASANIKGTYCNALSGVCGPLFSPGFNGASRNSGWYVGGGFDYMVHKGTLADVILGVEYQHYDVGAERANCFSPGCNPPTGADYDLSTKGDLVRARLTIKTQGYGFLWSAPAY